MKVNGDIHVIPNVKAPSLNASMRLVPSRFLMIFFAKFIMSFCRPQADGTIDFFRHRIPVSGFLNQYHQGSAH